MINRIDRKKIGIMPRAQKSDGVALCPYCWHVLCEPVEGVGKVAVWCRMCRTNIIVELGEKEGHG